MAALEELSESYQDKDGELALKSHQTESMSLRVEQLEVSLIWLFLLIDLLCTSLMRWL